jgi:toxin ParE1/3/4
MTYKVRIMPRAKQDLEMIYLFIHAASSEAARKWYLGFKKALLTLSANPQRCPVAPEHPGVHHLLYGRKPHVYRALFTCDEKKKMVGILHIRHGARQPFTAENIN